MSRFYNDDRALTEAEMTNNAAIIWDILVSEGWSKSAVAGILGNMEVESWLNPGKGEDGGIGFGLVQWTPPSKLYRWIDANYPGTPYSDGYVQIYRLMNEMYNPAAFDQYYATTSYPLSASAFIYSSQSPEYLSLAFFYNYERGTLLGNRRPNAARKWYDLFTGDNPPEPDPTPDPDPEPDPNPDPEPDPEPDPDPDPEPPAPVYHCPTWLMFKFRQEVKANANSTILRLCK